ncbi:MAG: hypothetical protein HOP33_08935 [Verrucomicrobia bacterium]|nr:hypothetical protein [Verrucomicrobiota bacterium]
MRSATVRINLTAAQRRGEDYVRALLASGTLTGTVIEISADEFHRVTATAKLDSPNPKAISEWFLPLRLLARQRKPGEIGIGDTAARLIGAVGGEQFKLWYHIVFKRDCKCPDRQAWLNAHWPYPNNTTNT